MKHCTCSSVLAGLEQELSRARLRSPGTRALLPVQCSQQSCAGAADSEIRDNTRVCGHVMFLRQISGSAAFPSRPRAWQVVRVHEALP